MSNAILGSLPPMRIGFDAYTIEHRGLSVEATLDFANEHRLDGVQFLEPSVIAHDLSIARLEEVRDLARQKRLILEIGLPSPNPLRRSSIQAQSISVEEHARRLIPHVTAVAQLGCHHARVYIGDRHDRFRTDVRWKDQLQATIAVVKLLEPALREMGVTLAIETHADATSTEIRRFLDVFETDVLGVTIDTGNLVMRLEDPLAVIEALRNRVQAVHVKDAVLEFTPRGLCWQSRPVGSGILPMPDLLSLLYRSNPSLMLSIELHPRTYDLPIYDSEWLAYFPELLPQSLAAVVRLAARCERRYAEGSLIRPELIESIPWAERDLDWLASSVGYLRALVAMLGRFEEPESRRQSHGDFQGL